MTLQMKRGTYRQVFNGTAAHTPGGLTSMDLKMNKRKQVVPILKSEAGTRAYTRIEDWVSFSKRVHKEVGGDYKSALRTAKRLTDDHLRGANLPETAENKRKFWAQYVADHPLPGNAPAVRGRSEEALEEEDDDGF